MTDLQAWVAPTYDRLADVLSGDADWETPSLCEGWSVGHVVAHVTMPSRITPEEFGREMAAAAGDFGRLSDTVAARDASLPRPVLLEALRSPALHAWQPPGGGEVGALTHAVVHSLDVTVPLDLPPVAPDDARDAVLQLLADSGGAWFGLDLSGLRLDATDTGWGWGSGEPVQADSGSLVALLSGRALPDGRTLRGR